MAKRIEDFIQYKCAEYLRSIGQPFFHVPNAGKRSFQEGARLVAMGMKAGVHDIWLLFEGNYTEPVELKTDRKGAGLEKAQTSFHTDLAGLQWVQHTIKTSDWEAAVRQLASIVKDAKARAALRMA